MPLQDDIINEIRKQPGITAVQLAETLNVERRQVNALLYGVLRERLTYTGINPHWTLTTEVLEGFDAPREDDPRPDQKVELAEGDPVGEFEQKPTLRYEEYAKRRAEDTKRKNAGILKVIAAKPKPQAASQQSNSPLKRGVTNVGSLPHLDPSWATWSNPFYYITHSQNLASILRIGIQSRNQVHNRSIVFEDLSDTDVQNWREQKKIHGTWLHNYVNLYLNPRNAMLYRIVKEMARSLANVCVLEIDQAVATAICVVSDRNAAARDSVFKQVRENGFSLIDKSAVTAKSWGDDQSAKQKMMAELLVRDSVRPNLIRRIHVANEHQWRRTNQESCQIAESCGITIVETPRMFFILQ